MPEIFNNFFVGVGSILELMPAPLSRFDANVRLRTSEEALRLDWERVGESLTNAIARGSSEQPANGTPKRS